MCFLPREAKAREIVVKQFEHFIKVEGQKLLGWRDVPTDPAGLGKTVLDGMPLIRQAIIAAGPHIKDQDQFERKLLTIRKQAQNPLAALVQEAQAAGHPGALHAQPFHPHGGLQGPAAGA